MKNNNMVYNCGSCTNNTSEPLPLNPERTFMKSFVKALILISKINKGYMLQISQEFSEFSSAKKTEISSQKIQKLAYDKLDTATTFHILTIYISFLTKVLTILLT